MGGIVATYATHPTGVEFFVDTEPEQVNVYVRARGNLGVAQQLALAREVEARVVKVDGIKTYATTAGKAGNGGVFGNQDVPADVVGTIQLELNPVGNRKPWKELNEDLDAAVAGMPGIFVEVARWRAAPSLARTSACKSPAMDRDAAFAAARKIEDHMANGMEGIRRYRR